MTEEIQPTTEGIYYRLGEFDSIVCACIAVGEMWKWPWERTLATIVIKLVEDRKRLQDEFTKCKLRCPPAIIIGGTRG